MKTQELYKKFSVLIPIKSISQRVPGKNFRDFGGKPLWQVAVDKLRDDFYVYIDTDNHDLFEQLKHDKDVTVYLRDESLLGHKTSVCELIRYWVQTYNPRGFLFQVHATSPFLNPDTLKEAYRSMMPGNDSVFSCTKHLSRFWFNGQPVNHDPKKLIQTQDLVALHEENSLFYGFTPRIALSGKRIGDNPVVVETDPEESMDIDTERDWEMCIKVLSQRSPVEIRENSRPDELTNIGIDFDGVIHMCSKGFFDGTIYDVPISGTKWALKKISEKYNIIIYTCKAKSDRPLIGGKTGTELIWEWLKDHDFDQYIDEVTDEKPRAVVYIDDKAILFKDWESCLEELRNKHILESVI